MRPLRGGLKSLAQFLEGVEDVPLAQQPDIPLPNLPLPVGFGRLYSLCFSTDKPVVIVHDLVELTRARWRLSEAANQSPTLAFDATALPLKSINLIDLAGEFCPEGVDLKRDVTLGSRKRTNDDSDVTIQHQKRRKGQPTDIIQTGRSSKKFGMQHGATFPVGFGGSFPYSYFVIFQLPQ